VRPPSGGFYLLSISIDALLAFGFLASQEVKDARVGNLGLWDREFSASQLIHVVTPSFTERLALHWVQKYICEFGGDLSKVTM
jgi:acetylcholinesterase